MAANKLSCLIGGEVEDVLSALVELGEYLQMFCIYNLQDLQFVIPPAFLFILGSPILEPRLDLDLVEGQTFRKARPLRTVHVPVGHIFLESR